MYTNYGQSFDQLCTTQNVAHVCIYPSCYTCFHYKMDTKVIVMLSISLVVKKTWTKKYYSESKNKVVESKAQNDFKRRRREFIFIIINSWSYQPIYKQQIMSTTQLTKVACILRLKKCVMNFLQQHVTFITIHFTLGLELCDFHNM